MKGKLMLVAGVAVGYVLGARAGRERYEQLRTKADQVWHDPKVQQKITDAEHTVKAKAPEVQEKVAHVAARTTDKVKATVQRHEHNVGGTDEAEVNTDAYRGYQQGRPIGS